MDKRIIIIDNYDSFTYNLFHLVKELGYTGVEVFRNDGIDLHQVANYDKIILSPGPGIPSESAPMMRILERYAETKSILGVCLGHQAIAEHFGGTLINLKEVYHGVTTPVRVVADDVLFEGLPRSFEVGRYHSWAVSPVKLPSCIQITAVDEEGAIMALRHETLDIHGIQFHPESILTPRGKEIMANWLRS